MITAGLSVKIAFLGAVVLIWVMILYQIGMTLAGYIHRIRSGRLTAGLLRRGGPLPPVSILVPARNEQVVIAGTLEALRGLRYPRESLDILVVDDGSTDGTSDVVREIASQDERVRLLQLPPKEQGRGKAHALNVAWKKARHEVIAVYDADNRPEPQSLEILVRRLTADNSLGAVLGKFRTANRDRNLLTRFINLETLAFQWIVQAGRCALFGVGVLPGTNFVIHKRVLAGCDGWDEKAVTEDTELSVRIYELGWKIDFAPEAVTWEEEPEKFGVWLRQRTRWVRGSFYIMRKYLLSCWKFKSRFLALQVIYLTLLYYLFLFALVLSHLVFLSCVTGILRVDIPGPYNAVWISAVLLFVFEIYLVASYEEEHALSELAVAGLMYFTYCQAWLIVVFRALWQEHAVKDGVLWEKTERFGTGLEPPARQREDRPAELSLLARIRRGIFQVGLAVLVALAAGTARADTFVEYLKGREPVGDSHWGEVYAEAVFESGKDGNLTAFVDLKDGFRLTRFQGAELFLYAKLRPYKDINGDYWNNKAIYGPGLRLRPFPGGGLILFTEYLFGNYYGIEGEDENPYSSSFHGLEAGAAYWRRWGSLSDQTVVFPPLTAWRELYWDVIYFERDGDNVIGNLHVREGFGHLRLGRLAGDLYVRLNAGLDRNRDYWNNNVQAGAGIRFRKAEKPMNLQASFEIVGGTYLGRADLEELPYDRKYLGIRLEATYWFGW